MAASKAGGTGPLAQLTYLVPAPVEPVNNLLREVAPSEQPIARFQRLGPTALSNAELLSLVVDGRGDALVPYRVLNQYPTLHALAHASVIELQQLDGVTLSRAARIGSALELGRRMMTEQTEDNPVVRSPADGANILASRMANQEQEQFWIVALNTKNRLIAATMVYQGSVHTTVIRVGEVFKEAIRQNASAILVGHNHPSSTAEIVPSPEDVAVTREIIQAGKLLDIEVLDHLVLGTGDRFVSMKERNLGFG